MYLYPLMNVSEKTLKWAMRFYPPLFFQGIWTRKFDKGFKGVEVSVHPGFWNKNYNRSVFGGTLYAAGDPFYAILFDRNLRKAGYPCQIWLKQASISYLRPVTSRVYFHIQLSEDQIEEVIQSLMKAESYTGNFPIEMKDKKGQVFVRIQHQIYIRSRR